MRRILSVIAVLAAYAGTSLAQIDRGTFTGVITDRSGAVIVNAKITAVQTQTNTRFATATTETGNYTLAALELGRYRIEVETIGFKRTVRDNVGVSSGSTVRLDVALEVGRA